NYTLFFPGNADVPALPAGDGFGAVRVLPTGQARFVGTLADATRVSGSATLSKSGLCPLYIPLYLGKGSLVSWLAFTNRADDDLNGPSSWIKPADPMARYYHGGFTNELNIAGSGYVRPLPGTHPILNLANSSVTFSGGDLYFTNLVALDLNSRVTNLSSNRFALSFSLATGTFAGRATDPANDESFSFKGAVMQKLNGGYGFLLQTNRSSRVTIAP
ncbi:MAG: hypothetical protein QOJ40_161, partial [Verrucomicrobiota bacterium]